MSLLQNVGPQTFELGKNEPPGWNPLYLIKGSVKLVKHLDEYSLLTDTQCHKFTTRAETEKYLMDTPTQAPIRCDNPADPGYTFHIKGDAYIVLTIADDLDGWASSDDAIQTASNMPKDYFALRYWDKSSKSWVKRTAGLNSNTICFGARCKSEVRPNKEVHKIWYAFKLAGSDTYFDPDIRNPQEP